MPITARGIIATLDYWSLPKKHGSVDKQKAPKKTKPEASKPEGTLLRMLASNHPPDLQELSSILRPIAIREPSRDVSSRTRKLILGRVATLTATPEAYHELYAAGQQPKARLAQRYAEKWRRAIVSKLTTKAPAYEKAKHLVGGEIPSLDWLSNYNISRMRDEVGAIDADEIPIYERITQGPLYFKHTTDAATRILSEGRLMAPALGIASNGTTPRNQPFNHLHFVFGRLQFNPGPSRSRFGASTFEIPFDAMKNDISISLHDQNMPFGGITDPHDTHDGAIIRRVTASVAQPTNWLQQ